jgi:predicted DNA-binding transcriptional regulator AlpA
MKTQRTTAKLLTTEEAAAIINLVPRTLKKWRGQGKGPRFSRLGHKTVRYTEADVLAWVGAKMRGEEAGLEATNDD